MLLSRSLKPVILGYTLAAALILGGCDRQSSETAQPQAAVGARADNKSLSGTLDRSHKGAPIPDFTLKDAKGTQLRLPELEGTPLLINLWATWCGPCVVELPMLDKLAASNPDTLRVLTVSQDSTQTDKVGAFLSNRGIEKLEPWLDPENDLSFHYQTGTLPTTIYYDGKGREVWRFAGGHDWSGAATAKMLAEGLK